MTPITEFVHGTVPWLLDVSPSSIAEMWLRVRVARTEDKPLGTVQMGKTTQPG